MSAIPAIDEQVVLERVGEQGFQRGLTYFQDDAISDARRQGMTLKARCAGTSAPFYRVEVTFATSGLVDANCTCPVGGDDYCKHVVALLLTRNDRPEQFREVEELERALERRSKAELIALVKQLLRWAPELEMLLETPLPVTGRLSWGPLRRLARLPERLLHDFGLMSNYGRKGATAFTAGGRYVCVTVDRDSASMASRRLFAGG